MKHKQLLAVALLAPALHVCAQQGKPEETEVWTPVPAVVTPGSTAANAPSDAIVLFDGKDLSKWESEKGGAVPWTVADGAMTVSPRKGGIKTKDSFEDFQLHIEFRTPSVVKGEGQGRGNSGIFLQSFYELQVLDNYNNKTYSNGQAGSLYKQSIPLVNACRKPGEWQSYDVIWTAPRFNADGSLKSPARATVLHNGVLVQNNTELLGKTLYIGKPFYEKHGAMPLTLQDHGDLVSYRNIWIRKL
ncbi:3-keto-disaccharide hydrolase [Chitinophaga lutea]